MELSGFLPRPLFIHDAAEGEAAVLLPSSQGQLRTLELAYPPSGCLLGPEGHGQICAGLVTVRCGSIFRCSYGAAEVVLGSVSWEGWMWVLGLVGIRCWEGRPSEGFGRPGGEGVGSGPF